MPENYIDIDIDSDEFQKLSRMERVRILRAKGIAGKGDYTRDRHKWLDKISEEELDAELLKMARERKKKKDE